jgi:hypothetical protein
VKVLKDYYHLTEVKSSLVLGESFLLQMKKQLPAWIELQHEIQVFLGLKGYIKLCCEGKID